MGNDDTNFAEKRNANKSSRGKSAIVTRGYRIGLFETIFIPEFGGRRALTLLCCIALLCYALEFEARFLALNDP